MPAIYQLEKDHWLAVKTEKDYIYGEEGGLYACAEPAKAGTFALFAYYNGPAESKSSASVSWEETTKNWFIDLVFVSTEVFNFVGPY